MRGTCCHWRDST